MKSIIFFVALMLSSLTVLTAQGRILPFRTTSSSTDAALHEASLLWSTANFSEAKAVVQKAMVEDPELFMAYMLSTSNYPTAAGKVGMIDKALAVDTTELTEAERTLRQKLVTWKTKPTAKATIAMR